MKGIHDDKDRGQAPDWEAQAKALAQQNRVLKEQLGIWKRKAGEMQLIAGRWQFLFEEAQKMVNKVDDLFEYAYASMHPVQIKESILGYLEAYTNEVKKVRRSPTEKKD